MWRRCQGDTSEISAGYAGAEFGVNVSYSAPAIT
jgi:hypothetical protein